jgi:hypothetical protein
MMKSLAKACLGLGLIAFAALLHAAPHAEADVEVEAVHKEIQQDTSHVVRVRQRAAKDKDVIKLTCVNDKLTQIQPLANIGDRLREELLAADDRVTKLEELRKIADEVRRLREEADQCVGDPIASESDTTFTSPSYIPDDPTDDEPWGPAFEEPGYASPFN